MKPKLPKFPTMLRKMWSGTEVQQWLDENVLPLFEQTAKSLTVAENHGCHGGDGATLPAAIEADSKHIEALDIVARSSRSVDQLKEALQDRSQQFTASYSEVMNLIGFYEAGRKRTADLIARYQEKIRALEVDNYSLVSELDDRQRRGEPVNTDAAGYTKGPVSNGGMDPRNTPVEPISSMPAEPVKVPSHETIRLVGVIANKIEDGTLFNDGIFSRKELAEKVREVLIFAAQPELKSIPNGAMLYTTPQPQQIPEDHSGSTQMFLDALTLARDNARGFMNKTGPDTDSLPEIDLAIDTARAMLEAAPQSPQAPEGYKLVPIEPTPEMLKSGWSENDVPLALRWKAMLEAAPEVKP